MSISSSMRCPVSATLLRRFTSSPLTQTQQRLPQARNLFGNKSQSRQLQLRVSHPLACPSGRSLGASGIWRSTTLLPSSSTPKISVPLLTFSPSSQYIISSIRHCSSKSTSSSLDSHSIEASEPERENPDEMPSGSYYQFLLLQNLMPHRLTV